MNQPQKPYRITLIGESCYDVYRMGKVNRLNPEAPVPILDFGEQFERKGMVSNVDQNLFHLSCNTLLFTDFFEKKIRYLDMKTNHQILREDSKLQNIYELAYNHNMINCDAIVISDYNKGYVTYELIEKLRNKFNGPIFIDTKKVDLQRFNGCFVKINENEFNQSTSHADNMIITYGAEKVVYRDKIFNPPKIENFDACGCGDTFLAFLTYGYLESQSMDYAIELAIKASAVTVQHLGVYAPFLSEIN